MSSCSRTQSCLLSFILLFACLLSVAGVAAGQVFLTSLPVGSYPVAVAVNPQTNKIYVVNRNSNNVTVIDGATNNTTTVSAGSMPIALAIHPVTNKIYVANAGNNTLTIIDGTTNLTSTVGVGNYPTGLDVNPVTNRIYVADYSSNAVTVVDGATYATVTVGVGTHPTPVAVNAATNKIYVGNRSSGTVTVIDGASNSTLSVGVGTNPSAIAINRVTNQIYVANYQSGTVSVIDGATNAVSTVTVGTYPNSLAVDAVHNVVYVSNSGSNSATIINGATLTTSTIAIGTSPNAVDVDPITDKAYFTTLDNGGSVVMVNGADNSTVSVLVGYIPSAIAVNPISDTLYTADLGDNTASVVAGGSASPLQFTTMTPCRVVDTRQAQGPFGGPALSSGTSRSFLLPLGGCGIPSTALAYSLNVTVVPAGPLGYLTIWPTGEPQPQVSTLNSPDGRVKANAAIVPAGAAGAVSVFVSDTANVLIDINGYFTAAGAETLQFYPLTPCRVLDTRNQSGHLGGPYLHGSRERDFPVLESSCPVPATAQAYSMNFTVVPWQNQPLGYLSAWAAGSGQPVVSTLNNPTATIVANAAIVPAGVGGAIAVYPSQSTDLVVDIDGYFAAPASGGLSLYPTAPCRVLDTRSSGGAFNGQRNPAVNVAGSACGVSSTARAYTFNATALPLASLSYLTLWPDGAPMPLASTLNAKDGLATSNMAILPNQDGEIDAYASGTTQLILDISGYFAPQPSLSRQGVMQCTDKTFPSMRY